MKDGNPQGTNSDPKLTLNLSGINSARSPLKDVKGYSSPRIPALGSTPLSARPRSKSTVTPQLPFTANESTKHLVLEAQLIVLFDSAARKVKDPDWHWSLEDLSLILRGCKESDFSALANLKTVIVKTPLTAAMYHSLFSSLWQDWLEQHKPVLRQQAQRELQFAKLYARLKQPQEKEMSEIPDPPFLASISKKEKRQRLKSFWSLTLGLCTHEEFSHALLALSAQHTPKQVLHCLNQLLNHMEPSQLVFAQWIAYFLLKQQPQAIKEESRTIKHFWTRIKALKQTLEGVEAYHVEEILNTLAQDNQPLQHTFLTNLYTLQAWCMQAIRSETSISFTKLLDEGLAWETERDKQSMSFEIAAEMMKAVASFYQKLPLLELTIPKKENWTTLQTMSLCFQNFHDYLLNRLLPLEGDRLGKAVEFLLEVARNLSGCSHKLAYADLSSLMAISLILLDINLEKKINAVLDSLSPMDRRFAEQLKTDYFPAKDFLKLRKKPTSLSYYLPCYNLLIHDLERKHDCNADPLSLNMVIGKLMQELSRVQESLQTTSIFFNTNILEEMGTKESPFAISKPPVTVITWNHSQDFLTLLKAVTEQLNLKHRPEISYNEHRIETGQICDFLWEKYMISIAPTDTFRRNEQAIMQELFSVTDRLARLLRQPENIDLPQMPTTPKRPLLKRLSFHATPREQDDIRHTLGITTMPRERSNTNPAPLTRFVS